MIDRLLTQVLYAVTGIILARELSQEDFGIVGAALVFQAFASLMVDGGFAYALLQRKENSRLDYSTVLWFNMGVAVVAYVVLYAAAPLIASWFQHDDRIIPIARVLFLSLILNAAVIVQVNRLVKAMNVRMVAISNTIGLAAGAVVGIWMAFAGFGAWAIVGQTLVLGAVKAIILWATSHWTPLLSFSWQSLRSYFGIGSRMMVTSFLNTLFLNIYSFFIGNRSGLVSLGYYTQSDKWSKMGIASLSQVLTSTFLPTLAAVQDDPERYARISSKINRFTAYLLFPAMLGLMALATPIFHALFGAKWDPSILLFQILLFRGIFVVLNALWNNFLLALGHARAIMWLEVFRDGIALVALALTWPYMTLTTPTDPVYGVAILLIGQLIATFLTWIATLVLVLRYTGSSLLTYARDLAPYAVIAGALSFGAWLITRLPINPWLQLAIAVPAAIGLWIAINNLLDSKIQQEIFGAIKGRRSERTHGAQADESAVD